MGNNHSSMDILTVSNRVTKPQDTFKFRAMTGVDKDGETIRTVDMKTEFENNYFVLFFFPMDFKVDSSEVLSFKEHLDEFTKENCEIVGVTSDSPWAVKRWIIKDPSHGGFGGPVGFPILSDKDLSLSMSVGVAMDNGNPARATFIIDWTGTIRYMMIHRSDIGRSVKEILRLVKAFRHSDLTGEACPSGWIPGDEVIPTDYSEKVKYYTNKFGQGGNEKKNDDVGQSDDKSTTKESPFISGQEKSNHVENLKDSVQRNTDSVVDKGEASVQNGKSSIEKEKDSVVEKGQEENTKIENIFQ